MYQCRTVLYCTAPKLRSLPFSPKVVTWSHPCSTVRTIIVQGSRSSEDTPKHAALEEQQGFSYDSLLGEHVCAHVSFLPDIGYHMTTLGKFSTAPRAVHYTMHEHVA